MIEIGYRGWFQVRLATDPDPYDEPRGVSGYVRAYAGEPDLDRIIRFQRTPFERAYGPPIGVQVHSVTVEGNLQNDNALVGASVDLLGASCFEGRNGVIAEDGFEPIYPYIIAIQKDAFRLDRSIAPRNPDYPYEEFLASGVEVDPAGIASATGIGSLRAVWQERVAKLDADLAGAKDPERTAISERLSFLREQLARERGALRFFGAKMSYSYSLKSPINFSDSAGYLPKNIDLENEWRSDFWFGGWDADVLCAFCLGTLRIPLQGQLLYSLNAVSTRRP
jgi:hypothetical protein